MLKDQKRNLMRYQDRVKNYLPIFLKPGWISLAIFVGYCVWFVGYNYPCDGYLAGFFIILFFAIVTGPLFFIKSHLVTIGISFGAISGSLLLPSSYFSIVEYKLIHDELAFTVATGLFMGLSIGAIIGAVGGVVVWLVYTSLNRFPYFQKIWIVVIILFLLLSLPWLYDASWGTFGYRWIINRLVVEYGDDLFETLVAYDKKSEFARNSMHVSWVEDNTVDVWVARRKKSSAEKLIWIASYTLQLENGEWKVSQAYGICGGNNNCQGCYDHRDTYVFQK